MIRLSPAHLGASLTALAMLLFALMDAMSKLLIRDYPISETLWIRYVIFALFALLLAKPKGFRRTIQSANPWLQATRALLSVFESASFVIAFQYLPLAETHAVASASPLIVVAMSAPLLGERISPRLWASVLIGFAGVLLIIHPGFERISWPLFIPLVGALLWAVYQIMVRFLARDDMPQTTLLWSALVGLAAVSLVGPWGFRLPDALGWGLLCATGVLFSVANYALIRALDYTQASTIQPYGYTMLVWAALLGWLVFGDVPGPWTILGACIVVLSGLYAWTQDREGQ